jgi:hypothetical protein
MPRISRAAAVACALAFAFGACGGGKSYTGLPKSEFLKQTNATCKSYNAQFTTLFGHVSAKPTLAEIKSIYKDKAIPLFRKEVISLRVLNPPPEDRAAVKKIFDDLTTGVDQLETAVTAASTLKELEAVSPAGLKTASAAAKAYGLTDCGGG